MAYSTDEITEAQACVVAYLFLSTHRTRSIKPFTTSCDIIFGSSLAPKAKSQGRKGLQAQKISSQSTCISIVVGGNIVLLGWRYISEVTNGIYPYQSISLYCYFIPTTLDLYTIAVDPVATIHPKVSDILRGVSGF